jgi:plastocyanin
VKTLASVIVLFAIISIISISPSAFAEVTITTGSVNLSIPGCEETDECYTPSEVTVDVGEKIIMTNTDSAGIHTFTSYTLEDDSPTKSDIFSSPFLTTDNPTFEWTPDTAGEIPYYCELHAWMKGTIIVQEAGAEEETDDAMEETDDAMEETDDAMEETDDAMEETDDASEKKGNNASAMGLSKMSPRAQMNQGVDSADVQCRQGFELVMKNSNGSAACVNSQSVEKLIQRGWASLF